jgi:hypothetical protein
MFDWIIDYFKPKPKPKTFLGDTTIVITDERIDLEHKGTEQIYSFWIAHSADGAWYAITDETQNPKFCLVVEDRDQAYSRGVEALNSYFTYLDHKEAK